MSEKVSAKLKPCPFCGGPAKAESDAGGIWNVCCRNHECCFLPCDAESWMEAVSKWNARNAIEAAEVPHD